MTGGEAERLAYLRAIGIDVWLPRGATDVDDRPVGESAAGTTAAAGLPAADDARPPGKTRGGADPSGDDWQTLRCRVGGCTRCDLHRSRTQTVFGVGDEAADLMVIGEAPGAEEDRRGEPFVGRAGRLLDEMLRATGLRRDSVFIANILKCRPPRNRDPKPEEARECRPYLARQIELVQPRVILAVGRIAAQNLLATDAPIGRLRTSVHRLEEPAVPVIVTYHPAYLLRSPAQKRKAWEDLCRVRALLAEAR